MNDQDRPIRHPSIETAVFGTEAVLYDERSGRVHYFNASACAIWLLLDGRPVAEIVDTLAQTTAFPPDEIRRDVLQAIDQLEAVGLLG
jgi:PqqD family protein of HPr-rel-A system